MFAATCVLLSSLGHVLMSGTSVPWWTMAAAFAGTSATGWLLAGRERGLPAVTAATVGVQIALHGGFSLAQAAAARPQAPGASPLTSLASVASLGRRWAQYLLCAPPVPVPAPAGQPTPTPDTGGRARHILSFVQDTRGISGAHVTGAHEMHGTHGVQGAADGVASIVATLPLPPPVPLPLPTAHAMGSMSPTGMLAGHLLAALLCGLWLAYGERGAFRVLRAVATRLLVPLRLPFRLPAPPHRPRVRLPRDHRVRTPRRLLLSNALTSRGPPHGIAVV